MVMGSGSSGVVVFCAKTDAERAERRKAVRKCDWTILATAETRQLKTQRIRFSNDDTGNEMPQSSDWIGVGSCRVLVESWTADGLFFLRFEEE